MPTTPAARHAAGLCAACDGTRLANYAHCPFHVAVKVPLEQRTWAVRQ